MDPGNSVIDLGRRLWATTPLAAISTGCRTKEYALRDGFLKSLFSFSGRPESKIKGLGEAEGLTPCLSGSCHLTVFGNAGGVETLYLCSHLLTKFSLCVCV